MVYVGKVYVQISIKEGSEKKSCMCSVYVRAISVPRETILIPVKIDRRYFLLFYALPAILKS